MSHTDKDSPWWVQVADTSRVIDHDHRDGRCVVSDDRRDRWNSFGYRHRRVCKHRVEVHFECTKAEPYVAERGYRHLERRTCWTTVCDCPVPERWKLEDQHGWGRDCRSRRIGCVGHVRVEWDDTVHCECDDVTRPTCFPRPADETQLGRYTRGGVPSRFVRSYYHKPERAREREDLGRLRQLANAGADLDDMDFENRQARGSCRWLYW